MGKGEEKKVSSRKSNESGNSWNPSAVEKKVSLSDVTIMSMRFV